MNPYEEYYRKLLEGSAAEPMAVAPVDEDPMGMEALRPKPRLASPPVDLPPPEAALQSPTPVVNPTDWDAKEATALDGLQAEQKSGKLFNFLKGLNTGESTNLAETFITTPKRYADENLKMKEYFKEQRDRAPTGQQTNILRSGARQQIQQLIESAKERGDTAGVAELENIARGLDSMDMSQMQKVFGKDSLMDKSLSTALGWKKADTARDTADALIKYRERKTAGSDDDMNEFSKDDRFVTPQLARAAKEFRNDEVFKQIRNRMTAASEVMSFLTNPASNLAANYIGTAMARLSGDKGALSNYDVTRYRTLEGMVGKLQQLAQKATAGGRRGAMVQAERDELWYISNVLKDLAQSNFRALKEDYIDSINAQFDGKLSNERIAAALGGNTLMNALGIVSPVGYKKNSPRDANKMLSGLKGMIDPGREAYLQRAYEASKQPHKDQPPEDVGKTNVEMFHKAMSNVGSAAVQPQQQSDVRTPEEEQRFQELEKRFGGRR